MHGRPSEEVEQRGPRGLAPGVRCRRALWQPGRRSPSDPSQRQARRESRGLGQGAKAGAGLRQGASEVPGSGIESRRTVNAIISSDPEKITHLRDAPPAPGIVEYCKTGRGPLSQTPRPGDITHRIGPSAPSPSLPARSYSVAPTNCIQPGSPADSGFSSISRPAKTSSILQYPRSLLDRYGDVTFIL
jgi:hypothetical protein